MLALVTGGSASGKSALAERICTEIGAQKKLYIATMQPWDDECLVRIAKHREMRKAKGFDTLECYEHLDRAQVMGYDCVLLECAGNLLANEMYSDNSVNMESGYRVLSGINHLHKNTQSLVVVSNDVFFDGVKYADATMAYIELLAQINNETARIADCVIECVCGIPIYHKGGISCWHH